jgi:hypothetical protein
MDVFRDGDMEEEEVMPLVCFTDPPSEASVPLPYILYPIGKRKHHGSSCEVVAIPIVCTLETSQDSDTSYTD